MRRSGYAVFLIGSPPVDGLPKFVATAQPLALSGEWVDAQGHLLVLPLIRSLRRLGQPARTLVITDLDLSLPGLAALYGYAHRRAAVAVVSTARLNDPANARRSLQRLYNVIKHELGHLDGRAHCRGPGCVMTQVRTLRELDARPAHYCDACARPRPSASDVLRSVTTFFARLPLSSSRQ